jgi:uncharacterized membrane protein YphA (DoxX/SURF4 family)
MCYKGIEVLNNINMLTNAMKDKLSFGIFSMSVLSHYIVFAHFAGGFLLAAGLLTRLACIMQIPILVGAVFFINSTNAIFGGPSELFLSIVVLVLLICFLVVGSGPWSLDAMLTNEDEKGKV